MDPKEVAAAAEEADKGVEVTVSRTVATTFQGTSFHLDYRNGELWATLSNGGLAFEAKVSEKVTPDLEGCLKMLYVSMVKS